MWTRPRNSLVLVVLAWLTVSLSLAAPGLVTPRVQAVEGVAITVSDMDRAVDFYGRVLAFEKHSDVEATGEEIERLLGVFGARVRIVRMQLGQEQIELMEYVTPRGRAVPPDSRSHDRWFQHIAIVVSDMDRAVDRLRRHRVEQISPAPQRLPDWNPNAAGIRAFYFKDPDGHPLELLQFPKGRGELRWHRDSDRMFLGIDHTAIVVGDTEASLRLYREVLGLRVVGESENHGPEQERLNNVFGARLRITTLRAGAGPAVELLEYLTPRDGRELPAGARANDLVTWHTLLTGTGPLPTAAALAPFRASLVSPSAVSLGDSPLGFGHAVLARDPDGHALQFRTR